MSEVKLTDAQIKAATEAFKGFDKKDEGRIKIGDISSTMKKVGHTVKPEFMEKIEDQIDADGTGFIDLEEFKEILLKKLQGDADERDLKDMFRVLDKEKKGEVNTSELRSILKQLDESLGEEDIDDMIADVDTDGSGWVDYDEFAKLMLSE